MKSPTRTELRYRCTPAQVSVSLEANGVRFPATLMDVSKSGIRIRVENEIGVDSTVFAQLPRFWIRGSVRYCKQTDSDLFDIGVLILEYYDNSELSA